MSDPETPKRETGSPDSADLTLPLRAGGIRVSGEDATLVQEERVREGVLLAGRYRVVRQLGRGGMGAVYEATDTLLNGARVAIKTILPLRGTSEAHVERFKREVALARSIGHENTCRVFDIGIHEADAASVVFLSMEILDGVPLSKVIEEHVSAGGPYSIADVLPIVRAVGAGLDAAHRRGIVHRDLKPANVMVVRDPTRRYVVTDFGLACLADSGDDLQGRSQSGEVVGTLLYMAPEQLDGRRGITAAADVYAFGIMLYELLTGDVPFRDSTPISSAARKLSEAAPSIRVVRPDLRERLAGVVSRCLAREPSARFQSFPELTEALESCEREAAGGEIRQREVDGSERRVARGLVAAAVVTVAVAGLLWLRRPDGEENTTPAARSADRATTTVGGSGSPGSVGTERAEGAVHAESPAGSQRAMQENRDGVAGTVRQREPFAGVVAAIAQAESPRFRVRPAKDRFVEREALVYDVSSHAPGYVYLFIVSADGAVDLVYPAPGDDNFMTPETRHVPPPGGSSLTVGAPFGRELHVAVLASRSLNLEAPAHFDGWNSVMRILEDAGRGVALDRSALEWAASSAEITTAPR